MGIKKELIERAKADGVIKRIDILLSGAYMLNSEASMMSAMAETLLERYGLKQGRLKWLANHLQGSLDAYCREFASMISTTKTKEGWMKDVSELHDLFFTWQSIPKEWKPGDPQWTDNKEDIIIKPANNEQQGILHESEADA